ncbi:Bacterial protein of unknown function (HtrL_YibB) [uncultured virus]|nr:Bacterial protein of unknown function (HtrL_YibB) [uncultured virus]
MSICLVSAFLDIGRQDWLHFRRSIEQYLNNFLPYTKMTHEMIVFMDDKHVEILTRFCRNVSHIRIIPINREWMKEHIYAYQQLPRESEIMASESFRKLVSHRLGHPECSKPEYNIMQHAKIDFLAHVINNKMTEADYLAWTDFGYFQVPNRIPSRTLDLNKFDLDRVNFQGMNALTSQDGDILWTLVNAPERVGGFFYLGRSDILLKYQELYHTVCKDFHEKGIVDDDQHIMIQCLFRKPDLFKVWNLRAWHMAYLYFQGG